MTRTFAVIGDPIEHSLSPSIHNAAFKALNLDCTYIAYRIPKGELKEGIESLRQIKISGFNVTIPHKIEMMQYLDESSPECKMIGATNTVSNENEKFVGYNTDMDGFLEPIKQKSIGISGEPVLVLGSGGAARAIVAGFAKEKAGKITIANRTIQKAQELAKFASGLGAESDSVTLQNVDVTKYRFIINATSVGLKNEPSPIATSAINANHVIYDIIYMPMNTDLIQQAKKNSATIIYGYEMLLGQASLAFQIWHKVQAPYEVMKKVLLGGFWMKVKATVNGAISLVNAIATWKGATLGITAKVEATVTVTEGKGIQLELDNQNTSSRLVNKVVEFAVPKKELEKNKIEISLQSEIPTGYGLKSSSAISSVISLACHKLFKPNYTDSQVLNAGIDASLAAKVSMTGAYDDACACYFGGIQVTDNKARKVIKSEKTPTNLVAVVFVPKSRKRGNVKQLKVLDTIFDRAWNFAKNGDYWNAMTLNGYATSAVLNSDPKIISSLIEAGALGASVSGNGPSIAAIVKKDNAPKIKKVFSEHEGAVMLAEINNKRAEVHEL